MKIKLYPALFLSLLIFGSCQKNDQSNPPKEETKQLKLIIKITEIQQGDTFANTTVMRYDDKGRITKIVALAGTSSNESPMEEFGYEGENVTTMKAFGILPIKLTYNNNLPVSLVTREGTPQQNNYTYTVVNGRVTKFYHPIEGYEYTYTGNNLATQTGGGGFTTYEYGTLKNPFYNARFKYMLFNFEDHSQDYFSENAVTKRISSSLSKRYSSYKYTAGDDGFPVSAIRKYVPRGQKDTVTTNVTYEYTLKTVKQ